MTNKFLLSLRDLGVRDARTESTTTDCVEYAKDRARAAKGSQAHLMAGGHFVGRLGCRVQRGESRATRRAEFARGIDAGGEC